MADYATLAELKTQLGITDAVDDTPLGAALTAASRAVDEHCGRKFSAAASSSRVYEARWSDLLYVDDIASLTGLAVKTDDDDDGTFETTWTVTTDFVAGPPNAIADGLPVTRLAAVGSKRFPASVRPTVEVTASFGWAAVPAQVKTATLIKAARLFRRKDTPEGVAGTGEFGVVRITSEDVDVKALLAPLVRVETAPGWGIG